MFAQTFICTYVILCKTYYSRYIRFITAKLHSKSKQQIESDAKNLGDIKVPLVGTLDQAKTSAQLKQDVASLKPRLILMVR